MLETRRRLVDRPCRNHATTDSEPKPARNQTRRELLQGQQAGGQHQHPERDELVLRWRVVIPRFDDVTVTVGSGFFPPVSIRPV